MNKEIMNQETNKSSHSESLAQIILPWLMHGLVPGFMRGKPSGMLCDAIYNGRVHEMREVVQSGFKPNTPVIGQTGTAVLSLTAMAGQGDCIRYLIACGATVDLQDKMGATALMYAAQYDQISCLKELLRAGAMASLPANDGKTAAMFAASWGSYQCLRHLFSHKALSRKRLNVQDKCGLTTLMHAAAEGRLQCMKYLVRCSADVNIVDNENRTALSLALLHHKSLCADYLLKKGCEVNTRSITGRTPLTIAMRDGYDKFVEKLLLTGATLDLTIGDERYMHRAITFGKNRIVRLLIMHGIVPSTQTYKHSDFPTYHDGPVSPFYVALLSNEVGIAKYFLSINFLTSFDVNVLPREKLVRQELAYHGQTEALTLLNRMSSQVWPLVKLCCVTISDAMGRGPYRQKRIKAMKLPPQIERMLSFTENYVRLCVCRWNQLPVMCNDMQYKERPWPSPLLVQWPVGYLTKKCPCAHCAAVNGLQLVC